MKERRGGEWERRGRGGVESEEEGRLSRRREECVDGVGKGRREAMERGGRREEGRGEGEGSQNESRQDFSMERKCCCLIIHLWGFGYVLRDIVRWLGLLLSFTESEDEEEDVESEAHHTLVLSDGDSVQVTNMGPDKAHFVLIAGQPIGEPVAQYGPFVMNTQEEINDAITDYNLQQNGFENAHEWRSAAQK
ncbi:putative pirin isoform X1 [Penaeus vannamei]|uniref:Putative pirin isoform X1 n=1 Tax=Penaeus vannamei TaxID=6689 RepID=A0A423U719_PENVA|nr:putative pirin isoform X1 [Penaeus vannamei]